MQKTSRVFLPVLVASLLSSSLCAAAEEHDHAAAANSAASISAVKGGAWSDASVWSGGAVPKAGDIVTIGQGMDLVLDVSPPALNGINLDGKLTFSDDKDLELTTEWIMMRGGLEIGTEREPHTRNATITLTDNIKGENINGMGDRVDQFIDGDGQDVGIFGEGTGADVVLDAGLVGDGRIRGRTCGKCLRARQAQDSAQACLEDSHRTPPTSW